MPVTQPELWVAPPFEARLVDGATAGIDPAYKKVLIGRGATNSKGPEMTELNAFSAIKAANGKLPVNLIIVAEGDEERMSMGLNKFVTTHPELLKKADAMLMFGGQNGGSAGVGDGGVRGLDVYRADDQRQGLGTGTDALEYSWHLQAVGGQPGVAAYPDAGDAGEAGRKYAEHCGLQRAH